MVRPITLIGVCVLVCWSAGAEVGWQVYEETNVKGTIRGTIKKDHIIQMQSGSVYQVSEITLQLVLELSPKALVLQNGKQFKLIIDGFDEPLICRQLTAPKSREAGVPAGLPTSTAPASEIAPDVPLERLMTEAQQREMGIHKLTKEERDKLGKYIRVVYLAGVKKGREEAAARPPSPTVKPASPSVIESKIDGDFEGWEGETIVKLVNGQIWQQAEYHYEYHYAFMPEVTIYKSGTRYKMKVEGVRQDVAVTRLK